MTSQRSAPILQALARVERRPPAGFGAPGHGAGRAATPDVLRLVGRRAFEADVLTPKGLDDRVEEGQVIQRAHAIAAHAWGADLCRFSTGGSTQSLHTALAAVARPGDTVVLAQNCHKAEFSAAVFAGLNVRIAPVVVDPIWGVEHGVDPVVLEQTLSAAPQTKAVVVVSPTYFGVTSDIAALAKVCHARDVPLIVDAAWGSAFGFCRHLPASPVKAGADVVVCSLHKTLSALAQGSLMLLTGSRVDPRRFALAYELFETTSPSVPVLASIDATRRDHALHGEAKWARVLRRARRVRARLAATEGLRVFGREQVGGPGAQDLDETKVLVDVSGLGLTGFEVDDWLQRRWQVSVGLSDARHVLAVFAVGTSERDAQRLTDGLQALARKRANKKASKAHAAAARVPCLDTLVPEMAMNAAAAFAAPSEMVGYGDAVGRMAAEIIAPAPPGVPRLIPGQRVTADIIGFLTANNAAGVFILDPADPDQHKLRVVKDPVDVQGTVGS